MIINFIPKRLIVFLMRRTDFKLQHRPKLPSIIIYWNCYYSAQVGKKKIIYAPIFIERNINISIAENIQSSIYMCDAIVSQSLY